jgi:hypothetical protein
MRRRAEIDNAEKPAPSFYVLQFYKLAVGARFEFEGKLYQKSAMDSVRDENGQPSSFRREREVTPVGEPLLLSAEEAELWKPIDVEHWADHLSTAPGRV